MLNTFNNLWFIFLAREKWSDSKFNHLLNFCINTLLYNLKLEELIYKGKTMQKENS